MDTGDEQEEDTSEVEERAVIEHVGPCRAVLIGNKLRVAISEENIQFQDQQSMGYITCTFGIATYPDDADTKELLLKKADECLYDGKTSGRNKVVAA